MDIGFLDSVIQIAGEEKVSTQLIDLVSASYDYSDHRHRPEAVVWPQSTREVAKIVELANLHKVSITPRGAGTSVAGGPVPERGGLVMDLCRMNRIMEISIIDRLAVVQPGVVYAELDKALKPHGYCFPPDPASSKVCTIGGNVATNAGGIRGAKYGVTKDYVLGLEIVLPTGKVIRTGGRCIKSSSGLDLTRLMVGSEGVLGLVTEIILKLSPRPLSFSTGMAFFPSLQSAGMTVAGIMSSGIVPSVMEIMDNNCLNLLRAKGDLPIPPSQACLLIETDGYTQGEADYQMEKVHEACRRNEAVEIRSPQTQEEAQELWLLRKSFSSLAAALAPNTISEDVTVPISKVPEMLVRVAELIGRAGFPFTTFGHAGDGNLHPKVMYDKSDPEQVRGMEKLIPAIFELTCSLGGTLSGEHGIGAAKAPYMAMEHDPGALELMRDIKKLVDPNGILNPGKMALS